MKSRDLIKAIVLMGAAAVAGSAAALTAVRLARGHRPEASQDTELATATANLRKKNEQLESLYKVVSEVSESLEIRYVIATTLRETLKLMRADMAVLRKLSGDELVPVGAMASNGQMIEHISSATPGVGPTGTAFERGQTVRIEQGGERMMAPRDVDPERANSPSAQTGRAPMESGLIVPLIIGARVVGTLSCWSRQKSNFDDDDEHILEMLASQVATAMIAAESMANSERRAVTDPLTELPNRLQFNDDLHGPLMELARSGRRAVIAMADIDHFKRFNDHFGHNVGDIALQKVAGVLKASTATVAKSSSSSSAMPGSVRRHSWPNGCARPSRRRRSSTRPACLSAR
jgi:GAF domain-containing protein